MICNENQELQFNQPQAPAQINNSKDALQIPSRPITRSRAQKTERGIDWANSRHFDCANKV